MNEPGSFDPAALERLLKLGGQKFTLDMIELFGSYGGKKLAEARQARQACQLSALAAAAHALKSSAGNVGAIRVQALAAQVELLAQEPQGDLAGAHLDELERAFAEAKTILELEQIKLAKPPA